MVLTLNNSGDSLLVDAAKGFARHRRKINKIRKAIRNGRVDKITSSHAKTFAKREIRLLLDELSDDEFQNRFELSTDQMQALKTGGNIDSALDDIANEKHIGKINNIRSIEFFESGLLAASPIGHIEIADNPNFDTSQDGARATGFLVGQNLLLTNQHVLQNRKTPEEGFVDMNHVRNRVGGRAAKQIIASFELDPDRFYLRGEDTQGGKILDFALVAVKQTGTNGENLSKFEPHKLIETQGKAAEGVPVNIIHHPSGNPKSVTVHDSHVVFLEDSDRPAEDRVSHDESNFCYYDSDTEHGSSGAPVFNNRWEVIALHQKSIPKRNILGRILDKEGQPIEKEDEKRRKNDIWWVSNRGVRISRVIKAIRGAQNLSAEEIIIRDKLLEEWKS